MQKKGLKTQALCACVCVHVRVLAVQAAASGLPAVSLLTSLISQTANSHQPRGVRCVSRVPAIPVPRLPS